MSIGNKHRINAAGIWSKSDNALEGIGILCYPLSAGDVPGKFIFRIPSKAPADFCNLCYRACKLQAFAFY